MNAAQFIERIIARVELSPSVAPIAKRVLRNERMLIADLAGKGTLTSQRLGEAVALAASWGVSL